MTILEAEYNGLQIGDDSQVILDFEFEDEKTFEFTLNNTSPTDDISQIELVTNLPREAFEIVLQPEEIMSGSSARFIIKSNSNKLIDFADENGNPKVTIAFTYLRKRNLFF